MNRTHRMTVKRRKASKGGLRTLFANVARKKSKRSHRAATTAMPADFESDVPNVGIGRALLVILAIHVVAIGGIFFHSYRLDRADESPAVAETKARIVIPTTKAAPAADLPKLRAADQSYVVGTGETYGMIADRFGIDERELRAANGIPEIRQGDVLRIPPKAIIAVEPPDIAALRMDPSPPVEEAVRVSPAVTVPDAGLVTTDAARAADSRPAAPRASAAAATSAGSYKVKPGDTFWGIAHKHGTSVDMLMKANGITDARKLKVGMDLKIPR
jgi:LysM repeat protein